MGIKTVTTYVMVDDMDGKEVEVTELPEPIELNYQGTWYRLYMSDVNAKKLDTYLAKILDGAETFVPRSTGAVAGPGAASEAQKAVVDAGKTFQEVKEWAIAQGLKTAAGKDISPSAPRLGEDVWKQYAKAHDIEL